MRHMFSLFGRRFARCLAPCRLRLSGLILILAGLPGSGALAQTPSAAELRMVADLPTAFRIVPGSVRISVAFDPKISNPAESVVLPLMFLREEPSSPGRYRSLWQIVPAKQADYDRLLARQAGQPVRLSVIPTLSFCRIADIAPQRRMVDMRIMNESMTGTRPKLQRLRELPKPCP